MSLAKFLNKNKKEGVVNISFSEEVKDGRQQGFNKSIPLKIRGLIFGDENEEYEVKNIKYDRESEQPSDYNRYFSYHYKIDIKKIEM